MSNLNLLWATLIFCERFEFAVGNLNLLWAICNLLWVICNLLWVIWICCERFEFDMSDLNLMWALCNLLWAFGFVVTVVGYRRVHTCSRQRVAQYLFQLALWKKKHFLWCWYCGKKQLLCVFSWSVLLSTTTTRHYSFPKHFFVCFCMLSEFAKGFERKVWRVQVAYLHNAALALSSLSRCFQLSTNLDRDFFFVIFDIVVKNIECCLAWHWWKSTDLGLCINWHAFLPIRMQKLLLVNYYSAQSRCKPNLESTSKYDFCPGFGWKKWRRSEHAHASYPGLFVSLARVQPLYGGGKKGEFRDWTRLLANRTA